jgi:hypothetical protein
MQDYTKIVGKDELTYTLKPESVTYFTTDYITKDKPVYASDVALENGVISWNEVADDDHCYYRVFTSDEKDFVPSMQNQIASTVSTMLKSKDVKKYIKVLSVDRSGNA